MDPKNKIEDHGGTRSGSERRKIKKQPYGVEKRSKKDRRSGSDRRKEHCSKRVKKNGNPIERRDVFREDV